RGRRHMDPFTTLGFARSFDLDQNELERRYRELQQALHPDKHKNAAASQRTMTLRKAVEVNEAYRVLRDDAKRAEALLAALGGKTPAGEAADPELLMEMLELREALGEAREAGDAARVAKLAAQVQASSDQVGQQLSAAFAALVEGQDEAGLARARELVS